MPCLAAAKAHRPLGGAPGKCGAGALLLRAAAPGIAPDADRPDANLEDVMC
jgi:hypothetical protein